MFGFGSPFTSPSSFYRPSRYDGYSRQPPCRCPDCYYTSGGTFNRPSASTRRPATEFGWPFSAPYTDAYGPTDGWTAPRRRVPKPTRKGTAPPARKEPPVTSTRGAEGGDVAPSLRGEADKERHGPTRSVRSEKDTVSLSQEQQHDSKEEQEGFGHISPPQCHDLNVDSEASSSGSESNCITDLPRGGPSDSGASPDDNPAMDYVIPSGDSPNPAPQPADTTFRQSTLERIAELSGRARELQSPAMSFAGEAGSKEYLVLSESLMELLLKLDLIESNGNREVRDARRSAVVMIQEILGLLESRAKGLQPADTSGADCMKEEDDEEEASSGEESMKENADCSQEDDVEDEEQVNNGDEAMKDEFDEQGESEEDTIQDDISDPKDNEDTAEGEKEGEIQ